MKSDRRIKKDIARKIFLKQIEKERTIGVDPIFSNASILCGHLERREASKEWKKVSNKYDRGEI